MYIVNYSIENTWLSWRSGRKVLLTDESGNHCVVDTLAENSVNVFFVKILCFA